MDIADMYKEELLEHSREPHNFGNIKKPDIQYKDYNPVCGDEIEISMKLKGKNIAAIKFTGAGCAISQAAASMLTDYARSKKIWELKNMKNDKMLAILPIPIDHLRIKCALLSLKAAQKGISQFMAKHGNA